MNQIIDSLQQFWQFTGFANCGWQNLVMILIGIFFITMGIVKEWEPLLLVPIGFGIILGNIPMFPGLNIGIYEDGSVMNILYKEFYGEPNSHLAHEYLHTHYVDRSATVK